MILEQTQNVAFIQINSLPSPLQDVHSIHKIKMYFIQQEKSQKINWIIESVGTEKLSNLQILKAE